MAELKTPKKVHAHHNIYTQKQFITAEKETKRKKEGKRNEKEEEDEEKREKKYKK